MWITGVRWLQMLFIRSVPIVIAVDSMSQEYEYGTADVILSKPIKRIEYLLGKYVGSFSLMVFIEGIITILGFIITSIIFGPQQGLYIVPLVYGGFLYSSFIVLSQTFMFSELFRKTVHSILFMIGLLLFSILLGFPTFTPYFEPPLLSTYIIVVYAIIPILIAVTRIVMSDVTNRAD
jgi:ABC-2 type transport system permease protein